MPRGRFVTRRFSQKRGTFWGRSPADATSSSLAASTAVLDATAVPVAEGETIVRVRGEIIVGSDQAAVNERWAGALGFCIASDQAVTAGIASLPTPYSDQDFDGWFVHRYFGGEFLFLDSTGVQGLGRMDRFAFDSKAMRKFAQGQTLCVIVENGAAVGTNYWLQYAVLFKVA